MSDRSPEKPSRRILVTGGAGFVGSTIAIALAARHPAWAIVALDNLKRRGSELNLPRLRAAGVSFLHGDVREATDLSAAGPIDVLVECSAEPSALAGFDGGHDYVVHSNLLGAWHCLELARRHDAQVVFLSTSRVYPVAGLRRIELRESPTRFELADDQPVAGVSGAGIAETFPLDGARTLYGWSKLSAELLIAEYADAFGLNAVINRCGVIAGPWQMGKVDQGVFTHWMLAHHFARELSYIGFGGTGKQVRDLLHVQDLADLVEDQVERPGHWRGVVANVSGGVAGSLSLMETTEICRELTGNEVPIRAVPETRPGDVPFFAGDCQRLFAHTDWRPRRTTRQILADTHAWISENEQALRTALD